MSQDRKRVPVRYLENCILIDKIKTKRTVAVTAWQEQETGSEILILQTSKLIQR